MHYLIDLILLLVIIITTFIGYKKGLIKVAFKLVSFILAIFISIILYKPLSNFIIKYTPINNKLEQTIETRLSSSNTTKEETNNMVSNYYSNIKNASIGIISQNIAITIVNVSCVLLIFILTKLILMLFKFSGNLISKLPVIKQLNGVGGFIYGIIKGFIIIYIFFAIVAILAPVININNFINIINSSIIANIMYNNNIIFIFFT